MGCYVWFAGIFWSDKSSFSNTPWHACPFDKNTARPTEFSRCSPSRLEHTSITSPCIIHQSLTIYSCVKIHLFIQAYRHPWELAQLLFYTEVETAWAAHRPSPCKRDIFPSGILPQTLNHHFLAFSSRRRYSQQTVPSSCFKRHLIIVSKVDLSLVCTVCLIFFSLIIIMALWAF